MMNDFLKQIGECELQKELIEAQKKSLLKKALEILANEQSSQNLENGKAETITESSEEDQFEGSPI